MQNYKMSLARLKQFLLVGELFFLFMRLVSQVLFTLPSSIQIMQMIIASMIFCRNHCSPQAQLYIILNIFILFALLFNEIDTQFDDSKMNSSPLFQNFTNNYKIWGYAGEFIYRIIGVVIAWRSYQFSKFLQVIDEDREGQNEI